MKLKPTKNQLKFLDWEFGVFFHFGIRSFYPGHKDWDGLPMLPSAFNPVHLDCGQWIRSAKLAGAKYAILVTKHHDGFANWPSKYSDFSVAQTPWRDGKGDVVKEFTDACHKYSMKVGLYYSPAQWGGKVKFDNPVEYDDYFINQITELLTGYGKIDYLWFDGCGSDNHEYDKVRIINTIRSLQPDIMIFGMWDPDTYWIGNEYGYADMSNPYVITDPLCETFKNEYHPDGSTRFAPAECDMRMRDSTWFDCESNADTVRSVDELLGIYEYSVGRGSNMLLNIGPDADGLLPEPDLKRLQEFGEALKKRYGAPLAFSDVTKTENGEFRIISLNSGDGSIGHYTDNMLVDTAVVEEDVTEGQAVKAFRIYANLPDNTESRICVYKGDTIGHKMICHFPVMFTAQLTLVIEDADGEVSIRSMKAYNISAN